MDDVDDVDDDDDDDAEKDDDNDDDDDDDDDYSNSKSGCRSISKKSRSRSKKDAAIRSSSSSLKQGSSSAEYVIQWFPFVRTDRLPTSRDDWLQVIERQGRFASSITSTTPSDESTSTSTSTSSVDASTIEADRKMWSKVVDVDASESTTTTTFQPYPKVIIDRWRPIAWKVPMKLHRVKDVTIVDDNSERFSSVQHVQLICWGTREEVLTKENRFQARYWKMIIEDLCQLRDRQYGIEVEYDDRYAHMA